MEWMLARDWFHSASRLGPADAHRVLVFQKKLYDDPDCVGRGLNFEHLENVHDRRIQSLRVEGGMRAIVWHDGGLGVLLYVDQHEPAYQWANDLKVNVTTLRGCVIVTVTRDGTPGDADGEHWTPRPPSESARAPGLFDCVTNTELREAGVPGVMLPFVRTICDDEALEQLTPVLADGLGDRLLALYLGDYGLAVAAVKKAKAEAAARDASETQPVEERRAEPAQVADADGGVILHDLPPGSTQALPLSSVDPDDFQRMLENPTEWWVAFADPVQRDIAGGTFAGPVLVTGGAGTGKTIVAMHRARHLARKGKRVLVTSYNVALCEAIGRDIALLCDAGELERITVRNIDDEARELCPDDEQMALEMDKSELFALRIRRATEFLSKRGNKSPFDAVIVDETQDVDVSRLALISLLAGKGCDSLTMLGDMNQRIYGEPLDLEDLQISVEGRTFTLQSGYRTTREIAEFGQRILPAAAGGADGAEAQAEPDIAPTLVAPGSGVSGPRPVMAEFSSPAEEAVAVAVAILAKVQAGVPPERIAVFARRWKRLEGVERALKALGVPCMDTSKGREAPRVGVRLTTMHQARGLEFREVFVIGTSVEELPDPAPMNKAETDGLRALVDAAERRLFHICCTRATHDLQVSWVGAPTDYLELCSAVADQRSGFDVTSYLSCELDTAMLADDPACFRIAGQDYVAGGRQIARVLEAYLEVVA